MKLTMALLFFMEQILWPLQGIIQIFPRLCLINFALYNSSKQTYINEFSIKFLVNKWGGGENLKNPLNVVNGCPLKQKWEFFPGFRKIELK